MPDLHMVDSFELPKDKSIEAMYASVAQQLVENRLTDSERDDLLDPGEPPSTATTPNLPSRPEVTSVALEWLATLRAYTVALKNLEEIGADKKSYHLRKILSAWGRVIGYVILILSISFEKEINVGGATISLGKIFGKSKSTMLRYFLVGTPGMISGFLRDFLATEKLRLMMAANDPGGNESATIRFLNEGLYLDLRLPEFLRRLDVLRRALEGRQFFSEALFVKLLDSYVRFPLREGVEDGEYRREMGELRADIMGLHGVDRQAFIGAQSQKYKKDRLISKLKEG